MSFPALAWAGKCKPGSASRKLVLFALADRHNDEVDGAYPSIAWLVEFTSLNRKTIISCLDELETLGFIADSGERKGVTKQVKLYRLHIEAVPKAEQSQKRNSSENGAKQSQKRDTDTVRTRSSTKATPSTRGYARALPDVFKPIPTGKCAKTVAGWPPGRLDDELEGFRDYHTANGTTSKDWQASFRTWVRNSKRWEPRNVHRIDDHISTTERAVRNVVAGLDPGKPEMVGSGFG